MTPGSFVVALAVVMGAGLVCIGMARAAEIRPGGDLELTISGFAGFLAHGGALDNQREDPEISNGLDFSNDTEVHVLARAEDEEAGLEYGATIEFAADTNDEENTDETWVFVRGGWGEVRVGDEDGPVDESVLNGSVVAGGTGGIDGDVVDELAVDAVSPSNTDVATKIRYYTPYFGNWQFGVSYTPNADNFGDALATTDLDIGDWVEGAVVYEDEFDTWSIAASLVGSWGRVENRDSETFGGDGESRVWTYFAGATVDLFDDASIAGGFGDENVGGLEKRYVNAGIGYDFGPLYSSVTHGRVLQTKNYEGVGEPWNLVFSADAELMPGLVLAGDLAYFDNDLDADAEEPTGGDSGWVWVTRLEVAF